MLKVRDIMTTNVVTIESTATVREAMELLTKRGISGAPVVDGGKLVGVVSATDLMTLAAGLAGVPTQRDLPGEAGEPAEEAEFEGEMEPAGTYFTDLWDDAGADVSERLGELASPEWNALEEHSVSEVMTKPPLTTVGPEAPVQRAAELMRMNRIHRVLVTKGGTLLAVVSALDVVRAVAEGRFGQPR